MYSTSSLGGFRSSEPRRGLILMVVLALLTAFAIVGLSFVLYADAEAKAAQIARESEQGLTVHPYDLEPKALLSNFLGQLIFDVSDPTGTPTDINSALRGHSLARSLFGYNDGNSSSNVTPFNGVGRLHYLNVPVTGIDEVNAVNYQWFINPVTGLLLDGVLHDPERPGTRNALTATRQPWLCGFNAPYTSPDSNNMFLAQVDSSGNLVQPSYHRQSIFGALDAGTNPNWSSAAGKYMTLRPRPQENPSGFPFPEDTGGDVKNLLGNPGGNDSIWLDGGSPVRFAANGKTYKAMFAPLIIELDSRINVSAHGNIMGQDTDTNGTVTPTHVSNTGWGPWTVNIGQVMKDLSGLKAPKDPLNFEWTHVFTGTPTPLQIARYGNSLPTPGSHVPGSGSVGVFPASTTLGSAFTFPLIKSPFYSRFTFDEGVLAGGIRTTTTPVNPILTTANSYFPTYGNGYALDLTSGTSPLTNHPLAYNLFAGPPTTGDDDTIFSAGEMESLLRFNDTTSYTLNGNLLNLCPNILAQQTTPQLRARSLITTRAFDIDSPGISPWFTSRSGTGGQFGLTAYTLGGARPLPALTAALAPFPTPPPQISTFLPASPVNDYSGDGRMSFGLPPASAATLMGKLSQRLDLNRPLPDYPAPDPTTGIITDDAGFNAAQVARQMFAQDIFDRLRLITGADSIPIGPSTATPGQDALRWLAQLAVNIVDFIDTDDYMTPFNWNPNSTTDVVYGVEMPRLLINEVFLQYKDPPGAGKQFQVDLWVELFNPLNTTGVPLTSNYLTEQGNARLFATNGTSINIDGYQIELCQKDTTGIIRGNTNSTGDPGATLLINTGNPTPPGSGATGSAPCQFGVKGTATANTLAPNSFWLMGPTSVPITPTSVTVNNPEPRMSYSFPPGPPGETPPAPTVVLRRLACPNRQNVPGSNDYVTVDYFEDATAGPMPSTIRPNAFQINQSNNVIQSTRGSYGRVNPFIGNIVSTSNIVTQVTSSSSHHTLTTANLPPTTVSIPWLTHLDRYLSSPMELLHVAGVRPFELTQTFGESTKIPSLGQFGHRVPWFDEDLGAAPTTSHCLNRLFELVETRSRFAGMTPVQYSATLTVAAGGTASAALPTAVASNGLVVTPALGDVLAVVNQTGTVVENVRLTGNPSGVNFTFTVQQNYSSTPVILVHTATGGRQAGKINLNTIQQADQEIMMALADPSISNNFTSGDVGSIFANMKTTILQTPFIGNALGRFSLNDVQYPTSGTSRSMFQPAPGSSTGATLFEPPSKGGTANHPYFRFELLNKMFNNTTSRSNVFAVWLTVGFFEVDANGKLGQEIGKSEGKNVRHRMFAIVDRTGLAVPRLAATLSANVTANQTSASLSTLVGINANTQLLIGNAGSNLEVVSGGTLLGGNQIQTSAFKLAHTAGENVYIMPGNWGPQPGFDVTQPVNSQIVPYFSIIE